MIKKFAVLFLVSLTNIPSYFLKTTLLTLFARVFLAFDFFGWSFVLDLVSELFFLVSFGSHRVADQLMRLEILVKLPLSGVGHEFRRRPKCESLF